MGKDAEGHFYFDIFQLFTDTRLPVFATNSPSFATTSDSVTMSLALDRKGTIYYAVGKAEISPSNKHPAITTTYQNTTIAGDTDHEVSLNPAAGEPKVPRNGPEDKQFAGMTPAQSVNAEPYDITNPLNQYIFNPQGWSDAMVAVATDHIENPGGALSTPVVKDLEPNTTYYVYFVLKGTAQEISRVYVYQFTTEPIRPPKITDLSPISGGDARTETDVNSLMDYRVFNAVEAGIPGNVPILQAKLNDAGNHNELNIPAPYTDYTILQALTTPFDIAQVSNPGVDNVPTKDGVPDVRMKDYTVFDIYASADAKRHVYNMILNGSTSGEYAPDMEPIDEGHNLKIKGTTPTTLELKDIKPGGTYLIVTMARNELSDENASVQDNFSFRAAERIGIVDQEAPKIDRFAGGSANPDRPSTSPTSQTYSGSFSIIFNTDIYWRQDANHRHYPAGGEDKFDADGNPTEKNILTNATINPKSSTVTASTTSVPTKIFTFNFEHMENNGSIIIEGGNLCNSSGQLANDNLVITFKEDATRFYAIAEWGSSKSEIELYTKPPMEMNLVSTSGVILTPKGTNYALTLNTGNTDNSSTILASLVPASNEYKFTWTGANQNVVTVDLDGSNNETAKITAVGVGKTTITVSTAGGAALKTIDVTVQAVATKGVVTADKTSVTFKAGDTTPKTVKLTTSPELGQAVVKTINPTTPAYESTLQKTSATTYSLKITPKKVTRKTTAKLQISAGGKKVEEITVTVNPTKN